MTKSTIIRHSIIWVLLNVLFHFLWPLPGGIVAEIAGSILTSSAYMLMYYYIALVVFPKFWQKNYLLFFIAIIIGYVFYNGYYYIIGKYALPFVGSKSALVYLPVASYLKGNALIYFFIVTCAAAWHVSRDSLKKINEQNKRENSLVTRELNYLKAQFNSHFMFNFLNFCYSHVHKYSGKAAASIDLYSNMLRYSLYTGTKEKVLLNHEIEYIENFIELQHILKPGHFVRFIHEGETGNTYIVQGILITFIEAALDQAGLDKVKSPLFIELKADNAFLSLAIKKEGPGNIGAKTGYDVSEFKQLLDLFYENRYKISMNNGNTIGHLVLEL